MRWLKFSKYLYEFGWVPTIYTPANPEPQAYDPSLLAEIPDNLQVIKRKIREPYKIFKILSGKKVGEPLTVSFVSEKKEGWISKLLIWIRGNFFIPDARKFWIKPSVRFLNRYLEINPHHIVVSTGPPHSMHLIALGLRKRLNIPWVADFRDPWTNIDFYRELKLTSLADRRHHTLERKVLTSADAVITIGPTLASEFKEMGCKNVHTITNGFDHSDQIPPSDKSKEFSILHIGSMPPTRNPETLWSVLGEMTRINPEFRSDLILHLVGNIDYRIIRSIEENGLAPNLIKKPHVPHHDVLSYIMESSVLLLVINNTSNAKGILTNKFFEYLAARKPILAIGPADGDAADILRQTGAGLMLDFNDREGIENYVQDLYNRFRSGSLQKDIRNIEQFSRRNLTSSLARLFDTLIS